MKVVSLRNEHGQLCCGLASCKNAQLIQHPEDILYPDALWCDTHNIPYTKGDAGAYTAKVRADIDSFSNQMKRMLDRVSKELEPSMKEIDDKYARSEASAHGYVVL